MIALFLTMCLGPGAGHMYLARWKRATGWSFLTPVTLVLKHARRELNSLTQDTTVRIVGPFRVAA